MVQNTQVFINKKMVEYVKEYLTVPTKGCRSIALFLGGKKKKVSCWTTFIHSFIHSFIYPEFNERDWLPTWALSWGCNSEQDRYSPGFRDPIFDPPPKKMCFRKCLLLATTQLPPGSGIQGRVQRHRERRRVCSPLPLCMTVLFEYFTSSIYHVVIFIKPTEETK